MVSLEDRPLAGRALGAGLRGRGRAHDQSSGPLPIEDRKLERVQDLSTLDDEAQRAFLSDYHRVLDGQTLAYYSRRRETPASDAMYEECILAARGLAGRAVERWFGMVLVTDYDRRFDEMAAEMYLDFGLDCEELWGLGLDALTQRLGDLVAGRLDEARSEMGAARFDMLARTVLVQTSDDLWCGHIERLHEMMAVAPLAPADHKSAVAAFQRDCAEEYEGFVQDTLDSLIPRLLAAADAETVQNDPEPCVELPAELSGILV
jgi:preprotein translocase subunit SecA